MTAAASSRGSSRRQSRLVRGNKDGFEICTVNHAKGGEVRVDATIKYADEANVAWTAHPHEDLDHDSYFRAYTPQEEDGCYIENRGGTLNEDELWDETTVCWWHMSDGAVLGVHDGMVIEYDPTTLAPLGMVVSKDELLGKKVAVIDASIEAAEGCIVDDRGVAIIDFAPKEQALVLYDEETNDVTVIQPNEDGSYWRKVVRNKMFRMKEMRRVAAAAKNYFQKMKGEDTELNVLSSYGPYTGTAGRSWASPPKAINPKAVAQKKGAKEDARKNKKR